MSGISSVIHPHTGDRFIDHFGQPINVGDKIVYPAVYGSSGAELAHATINRIVPLVEIPGTWLPTGGRAVTPHMRLDQQHKKYPTEYLPFSPNFDGKVDYRYAYVLSVTLDNNRPSTVKNVWNVVKEPA